MSWLSPKSASARRLRNQSRIQAQPFDALLGGVQDRAADPGADPKLVALAQETATKGKAGYPAVADDQYAAFVAGAKRQYVQMHHDRAMRARRHTSSPTTSASRTRITD